MEHSRRRPRGLPGWTGRGGLWTYQPEDTGAHVKAYPLGEDWYLDLWSQRGQLLALGTVPEPQVAALAPALTTHAGTWSHDRTEYAWLRFTDTAHATRSAAAPTDPAPAGPAPAASRPEDARIRAATAASPTRSAARQPLPSGPHRARRHLRWRIRH